MARDGYVGEEGKCRQNGTESREHWAENTACFFFSFARHLAVCGRIYSYARIPCLVQCARQSAQCEDWYLSIDQLLNIAHR